MVIHDFEEQTFHLPNHSHTYYELVYIWHGTGFHLLNKSRLPYGPGDLFVIGPEDEHYFEIEEQTRFTFIKFTDTYFEGHRFYRPAVLTSDSPQAIMRNSLLKEMKLQLEAPFNTILRHIVGNIVAYHNRKQVAASPLMYYQVLSMLGLITEAVSKLNLQLTYGQPDKEQLISHLHEHIYDPQQTQVEAVASRFAISPTYFSDYFRRNFGMSYRSYLNAYRIKLIEQRLLTPGLPLKQIAREFGFTDESHLSNFFKRKHKISPSQFKKDMRVKE